MQDVFRRVVETEKATAVFFHLLTVEPSTSTAQI